MLIFYSDENGGHSMATKAGSNPLELASGNSSRFVLSGVGVRDTTRKPLAEAIFALKRKHFGAEVDKAWSETELKGRHLRRAIRGATSGNPLQHPSGYLVLDTPAKVNALIADIGRIFVQFRPLLLAAVVDKKEMIATDRDLHPIGIAYAYLHQRIAFTMERLYAGDGAIVVADQQSQHEAFFRKGGFHEVRAILSKNLPRKPNYDLVLDKPLWVDTDLSSWDREILQLADIVAYTVDACVENGQPPAEACYLWEQMQHGFARQPSTGKIMGGGIGLYPNTAKKLGI